MSEVVSYTQRIKWYKACESAYCVEIGKLPHGDYAIRNSKFRANTVVITEEELTEFIRGVHAGAFDKLVEVIK